MTKKGVIKIELPAGSARTVGQLVMDRANRLPLSHTPLRDLPPAGRKLLKAVRRTNDARRTIKLWTMSREEAQSLFNYLALFFHPQNDNTNLLNPSELEQVREVSLALANALLSKPGRRPLSAADAEYVIAAHEDALRGTLPEHAFPPDPSQARKMRLRLERERSLGKRVISDIPIYLQALTARKYR